jgi:hypothetical protein
VALLVERGELVREGKVLRLAPARDGERAALVGLLRACVP